MEEILKILKSFEKFVLVGHISPDGDAIGSCFGLAYALQAMGKKVTVLLEKYPEKYNILPGAEFLQDEAGDFDYIVALDCADIDRIGAGKDIFINATNTICIDHHVTNKGFAKHNYIVANASSTSEIVYRFVEKLAPTCKNIATAIYAGIVCDTGGFKYDATAISTMEIATKLMATGIDFTHIYNEVLHMHTFAAAKAKGIVLENAVSVMDGKVVYSYITLAALDKVGARSSDLDGCVEYLINTNGAKAAAIIYEKHGMDGQVKISFRARGADVGHVATQLGGGGHTFAAGCTITATVQEAIDMAIPLMLAEVR